MQHPDQSTTTISTSAQMQSWPARFPIYFGWVQVVVAALAMLATLPGRTLGLGLINEQMLADLQRDKEWIGEVNFWATLIGASFCFAIGPLLDRFGTRLMLTSNILAFGAVIWSMSQVTDPTWMFVAITLTRGFGQSALSVISISLVGKWFQRRVTWAMALFSLLFYSLFAIAIWLVGEDVKVHGWRAAWNNVAWFLLLGMAPLAMLLTRNSPESCSVAPDEPAIPEAGELPSSSLGMALRTPAFWIFALATSCFNLVISGFTLYNESIFQELGFNRDTYVMMLSSSAIIGMVSQFITGWFSKRWPLRNILAIAMLFYGVSLVWLPTVHDMPQLWVNTVLMGASGGMITVVFFAIWSETYGRVHLGKIQGAAQALTVFSSAIGPWIFAVVQKNYGSYAPIIYGMAPPVFVLAVAVWRAKHPNRARNDPANLA